MSPQAAGAPESPGPESLSGSGARILAFEERPWRSRGDKALAMLEELGMTETRYYQVLGQVIDAPEALMASPVLVDLLRRRREARLAGRMPCPAATAELEPEPE